MGRLKKPQFRRGNVHHRFVGFLWFGSDPQKYLSLVRALIFLLHIGTHPSNTGKELLYYHLYHEEEPLKMDVNPQLMNRSFIIFLSKLTT